MTLAHSKGLKQVIERMLDKGIVIDAKLRLAIVDCQLLKLRATVILSSFAGAVRYGLDMPSEIIYETQAWRKLLSREKCPQCTKLLEHEKLEQGCPWCGYIIGT